MSGSGEWDRWQASEYRAIEKVIEAHLGEPYWKHYRDLWQAVADLLPPKGQPSAADLDIVENEKITAERTS